MHAWVNYHNSDIPRILLNCPPYWSSLTTSWESSDSRRIQPENFTLKHALNESISDDLAYKQQKKFYNIDDLKGKLNFLVRNTGQLLDSKRHLLYTASSNVYIEISICPL